MSFNQSGSETFFSQTYLNEIKLMILETRTSRTTESQENLNTGLVFNCGIAVGHDADHRECNFVLDDVGPLV